MRPVVFALLAVTGAGILLGVVYWKSGEQDPVRSLPSATAETAVKSEPMRLPPVVPPQTTPATTDVQVGPVEQSMPAEVSMAQARENGDARTPPIVRSTEPREAPTAAELANPELYQKYEQRQNKRLYSAYVKAANEEVPKLRQDIEKARAMGIPPEEIAKGEEKLRRIQEMRDQLLNQNPDINR